MSTTTLELPRSLFTTASNPRPCIVPARKLERLDQIAARQQLARAAYVLFAIGSLALAIVFMLGIAGR